MVENREKNNFYAVPLMGGILCAISILTPTSLTYFGVPFTIAFLSVFISVILEEVCGIVLIVFAVKLKRGKTTFIKQKKKLLILSLLALIAPIWVSIIVSIGLPYFRIFLIYGLTGGLITLIGICYNQYISKHSPIPTPTLAREKENIESYTTIKTLCTKCGFNSEIESLKFCPECGNQMVSKQKPPQE